MLFPSYMACKPLTRNEGLVDISKALKPIPDPCLTGGKRLSNVTLFPWCSCVDTTVCPNGRSKITQSSGKPAPNSVCVSS